MSEQSEAKQKSSRKSASTPARTGEPRVTVDQIDISIIRVVHSLAFTSLVDLNVESTDYTTFIQPALDNWEGKLVYGAFCNICKQILPASYKKVHFQAHIDYLTASATCSHHCDECNAAYLSSKHSSTGFYHKSVFVEAPHASNASSRSRSAASSTQSDDVVVDPVFLTLREQLASGFDEDLLVKLVTNDCSDLTPVAPAASKGRRKISLPEDGEEEKPKKNRGRKKIATEEDDEDEQEQPKAPKRRGRKAKVSQVDDEDEEEQIPVPRLNRRSAPHQFDDETLVQLDPAATDSHLKK